MEAPPVPSEGASASSSPTFFEALHAKHIHNVAKVMAPRSDTESALQSVDHTNIEFMFMEYMFLEGVYWGLTALEIMGRGDEMDKAEIIEFVQSCLHDNGGYGGNVGHDPTIVYVAIPKSCDWSRRLSMTDDALVVFPGTRGAPSRSSHYAMRWIESTGTRWPPTSPTCSRLVTDVDGD